MVVAVVTTSEEFRGSAERVVSQAAGSFVVQISDRWRCSGDDPDPGAQCCRLLYTGEDTPNCPCWSEPGYDDSAWDQVKKPLAGFTGPDLRGTTNRPHTAGAAGHNCKGVQCR